MNYFFTLSSLCFFSDSEKVSLVVDGFGVVVADSQYSSRRVRDCISEFGAESVIPFPSNQARDMPVLRVDRYFRVSGAEEERRVYGVGRACVERVNSRLEFVGLDCLKLRGLGDVMVHVLLCIIVVLVVAVAAVSWVGLGRLGCWLFSGGELI